MKKTLHAALTCLVAVACSDSGPVSPLVPIHGAPASWDELSIDGPAILGFNQSGTWTVTAPPQGCLTQTNWSVNGTYHSTGNSITYSSGSSFTLDVSAQSFPVGSSCTGSLYVEVWQECSPTVIDYSSPLYCDADIYAYPDGAGPGETCRWVVDTNMPLQNTVVNWYVDGDWKHTGPEFDFYISETQGDFEIYMTAENNTFGARNDHKTIPVGSAYTCNM